MTVQIILSEFRFFNVNLKKIKPFLMRNLILLIVIISNAFYAAAQTTAIPDINFEQELIDQGYDDVIDGSVLTTNISSITHFEFVSLNTTDLTGIEDFTALTYFQVTAFSLTEINVTQNTLIDTLIIGFTPLTSLNLTQNSSLNYLIISNSNIGSLDLSQNPNLSFLYCDDNDLSIIDISQNTNLSILYLPNNLLTNIDVTQNANLNLIDVSGNLITNLDLSQNNALFSIICDTNQLECLNIKNITNTSFLDLSASGNPNLTCIEVDDVAFAATNWIEIDAQTSFSDNCNNLCSLGISDGRLQNVSVYPNPTLGNLTIELNNTASNINLSLMNSISQVVLTKNYNSTNYINLNLDVPKGLYFLRLESNGKVITKKIIKE